MNTPPKSPVALVTGSGRKRVGWHVLHALALRGYAVMVHYHSATAEAHETVASFRALGVAAECFAADLAQETDAENLVKATLDRFGRIDVLVTCAAIWQRKSLEETTQEDLRRHFDINVAGTFFCAQHAGLAMARQPEGGCIITFGDWAVCRPYTDYAAYFATKGAIATLTRCLAVELGTRNPRVRVNCVEPGPSMVPSDVDRSELLRIVDATLVKREGTPEQLAAAVVFLIENPFVTGACLTVDGGRSIFAGGL